jgi:hypothetical protein
MRLFQVILAVYMLSLSLVPCSDKENDICSVSAADIATHSDTSHTEDHEDTCTPFCTCSCCGSGVAFISFEGFTIAEPISSVSPNPVFDQIAVTTFNHSIWQPPKI